MQNYSVPSAGSDGNYGAPTPHAAAVAHELFVAPVGNTSPEGGGPKHGGFDAMEHGLGSPSHTPGDGVRMPEVTELT